ncbi:hypothetical protein JCM11251_001138 [Rhodosporidiobolus azoricus]
MAPYLSMLPVRKAGPSSGLPLPASRLPTFQSTISRPGRPPQPEPPTPARSVAEISRFDLDGLLDPPGGDEDESALLDLNGEAPSWLADRSMFTVGGRTPAKGKGDELMSEGAQASFELEEDEEDQIVLASMGGGLSFASFEVSRAAEPEQPSPPPSPRPSPLPATALQPAPPPYTHAAAPVSSSIEQVTPEEAVEPVSSHLPQPLPDAPFVPPPPEVAATAAEEAEQQMDPATAREPEEALRPVLTPKRHRPSLAPLPQVGALLDELPEVLAVEPGAENLSVVAETVEGHEASEESPLSVQEPACFAVIPEESAASPPAASSTAPAAPTHIASTSAAVPISTLPPPTADPSARKPRSSLASAALPTRPAHLLPPSHPAHRRASLFMSVPPAVTSKKRAEEGKGEREPGQEEKKRKVREAKEERERKAAERAATKHVVGGSAPLARSIQGKPSVLTPASAEPLQEKESAVDTLVQEAEELIAALVEPAPAEQSPAADADASARHDDDDTPPSPFDNALEGDVPIPVFAFDGDTTLPAMGAPLDDDRLLVGGGAGAGGGAVTSTPARPMKRKVIEAEAVAEEEMEQEEQNERSEVAKEEELALAHQRKKARRTTLAVHALPPVQEDVEASIEVVAGREAVVRVESVVKVEEEVAESAQAVAPVELDSRQPPRRRPSRAALASTDSYSVSFALAAPVQADALSASTSRKAVRVSLLPPGRVEPPPIVSRSSLRKSLPASTTSSNGPSSVLSRSQRRASRMSLGPPLKPHPPACTSTSSTSATTQSVSLSTASTFETTHSASLSASVTLPRSHRRASRVSLAPPVEEPVLPPPGLPIEPSQPDQPLAKSKRRASRVSLAPPPTDAASETNVSEVLLSTDQLPAPSQRRASRVSLAPSAIAVVEEEQAIPAAPVETSQHDYRLAVSQQRSSRSSLAPPPEVPLMQEESAAPATDEQVEALSLSSYNRRASRVSLAPPPPTPPSRLAEKEQLELPLPPQQASLSASTSRRASRVPAAEEEQPEPAVTAEPTTICPPPVAHTRPFSVSTVSHSRPDPLSASTSSSSHPAQTHKPKVHAPPIPAPVSGVTLPSSFTFAASAADREAERRKRAEERERREKRAVEALKEKKKEKGKGGSAWAATAKRGKEQEGRKKDVKGKGRARDEDEDERPVIAAKRPKLASSLPSSIALPDAFTSTAHLASSTPHQSTAPAPLPAAGHEPLAEVPFPASGPIRADPHDHMLETAHVVEPSGAALTGAALATHARMAGSRGDLRRRVSQFLEGIGEELAEVEQPEEHAIEQQNTVQASKGPMEEVLVSVQPTTKSTAAIGSAPPPLAPSATLYKPSASASAAATISKPFTFGGTSRSSRAAPTRTDETASPMFVERLSSWKAREASATAKSAATAGSRVRKALASAAAPAPAAKRARVAVSEPRRAARIVLEGKENVPARSAPAPAAAPAKRGADVPSLVKDEMDKRLREKMEWSERQKKREEEVRRNRERMREEEAEKEREKLLALRRSLAVSRGPVGAGKTAATGRARAGRL